MGSRDPELCAALMDARCSTSFMRSTSGHGASRCADGAVLSRLMEGLLPSADGRHARGTPLSNVPSERIIGSSSSG